MRGVEGCILEDHHDLGPFGTDSDSSGPCDCQGWDTCRYCCWAFPVEQGVWVKDWDVELHLIYEFGFKGAIPAAHEAAATPLTRAILDICSNDVDVPFSGSLMVMARLLDIAILTGNQKAAVNLSKKCEVRPLRRWALNLHREDCCWKAARTALWAGADFQDLMVDYSSNEDVPFPQALFLNSKLEDWQEIRHLLPKCHDLWRPRNLDNELGRVFLENGPGVGKKLSLGKICAAEDAGVDLEPFSVEFDDGRGPGSFVGLLDIAIWCGQPDCALACVDGGTELEGDDKTLAWHKRVLRGESLLLPDPSLYIVVVPSEAQIAAAAAGCAWLKRLWKSESSQKGIALYQMMSKMFKGRLFPMVLVQEILTFSMPVPKIIEQLDLWEHVGGWMATICGRPASAHPAADCNTANVEEPEGMQDNGEAGRLPFIEVLVLFSILCFQGLK